MTQKLQLLSPDSSNQRDGLGQVVDGLIAVYTFNDSDLH